MNVFLFYFSKVAMFGILVALQIFLCKRKKLWLGLILPIIPLFFSITSVTMFVIDALTVPMFSVSNLILQLMFIFTMFNLPTVILLVIYFAFRDRDKKKKEIEKMNIQDL